MIDDGLTTVLHGDALAALRSMPDQSVHAVVTDPPYGLTRLPTAKVTDTLGRWLAGSREYVPLGVGFDEQPWDAFVPPPALWDEVWRVLKPGGYALVFAAPRTVDLMGLSLRLAGFEITDQLLAWVYGGAMAKSRDVSRLVDDHLGQERKVVGIDQDRSRRLSTQVGTYVTEAGWRAGGRRVETTAPASREAQRWHGWGTALKPAQEPIIVARRPRAGPTVMNVLAHGAGALHTDAVEVRSGDGVRHPPNLLVCHNPDCDEPPGAKPGGADGGRGPGLGCAEACQVVELGEQSADKRGRGDATRFVPVFRYAAKPRGAERIVVDGVAHVSVKPMSLIRWLVDLVAMPGMTVLDPFAGSGTVAAACAQAGVTSISVEAEARYLPLIAERLSRTRRAKRAA